GGGARQLGDEPLPARSGDELRVAGDAGAGSRVLDAEEAGRARDHAAVTCRASWSAPLTMQPLLALAIVAFTSVPAAAQHQQRSGGWPRKSQEHPDTPYESGAQQALIGSAFFSSTGTAYAKSRARPRCSVWCRLDAHARKRAACRSSSSRDREMGNQCSEVDLSPRLSTEELDARIRGKRGEREVHRQPSGCRREGRHLGVDRQLRRRGSPIRGLAGLRRASRQGFGSVPCDLHTQEGRQGRSHRYACDLPRWQGHDDQDEVDQCERPNVQQHQGFRKALASRLSGGALLRSAFERDRLLNGSLLTEEITNEAHSLSRVG